MTDAVDRGDNLDTAAVNTAQAEAAVAAQVALDAQAAEDLAAVKEPTDAEPKIETVVDDPEVEPKKAAKEIFIPKGRVDEMVKREQNAREAAERRNVELEQQLKATDRGVEVGQLETEIVALEKEQAKAMLDGDAEKAAALAGKIRLNERVIQNSVNTQLSAQAKAQASEDIRVDLTIEKLEVDYPQLSDKSEAYDQDVVDLVLATQQMYISRDRMPPSQALSAAAKTVMDKITPKVAEVAEEPKGLGAAKTTERKEAQVNKNIKTATAQPANLKDSGVDADKKGMVSDIDPTKLSFADFSALPEATKSRLRGDTL